MREESCRLQGFPAASLAAVLTWTASAACRAEDQLKIAVGGRGIGETFVTEVGYKAGLFNKHNLALDIFYTDGGGETQQAVISNSAQIGIASGFLGAIGVFAKGAPVRIIGGSYTGGAQVFWYVPANSPIRSPQDLAGKTVAYSNNGSSTHAGALALQKHYKIDFKPTPTGNAAATLTATMSGQVDVGWAGAPFGVAELEAGKTRLIMKSSDAPDFDKQTSRVIIANANELKARPDVFARFMRGYRDLLAVDLFDAGWAQSLCGVREAVGGDGQARIAGIPAACRGRSRSYLRDRGGDGRCGRLQIHHRAADQGRARRADPDPRTAAVTLRPCRQIGDFETQRIAQGVEPLATARPRS